MNIIKLNSTSPIQSNMYALLLHWTFIFELSEVNRNLGIDLEKSNEYEIKTALTNKNIPYIVLDTIAFNEYIDWSETERINSINKYIKLNLQTPSPNEPTLENTKNFRTLFAQYVLNNTTEVLDPQTSSEYDKQIFSVLDYWAKNMNSDTIKVLDLFFNSSLVTSTNSDITCGCEGTTGRSLNYTVNSNSICNTLDEFKKKNILMTEFIFSDILGFWKKYFSTDMIGWTITYLKNIIKCNLPLNFGSINIDSSLSCTQINKQLQIQAEYQQLILNIISALELIRDCKESQQYNFTIKALNNFGKIYPYLSWV